MPALPGSCDECHRVDGLHRSGESLYRGSLEGQCRMQLLDCLAALDGLLLMHVTNVKRLFSEDV